MTGWVLQRDTVSSSHQRTWKNASWMFMFEKLHLSPFPHLLNVRLQPHQIDCDSQTSKWYSCISATTWLADMFTGWPVIQQKTGFRREGVGYISYCFLWRQRLFYSKVFVYSSAKEAQEEHLEQHQGCNYHLNAKELWKMLFTTSQSKVLSSDCYFCEQSKPKVNRKEFIYHHKW